MPTIQDPSPYICITADTHAGAAIDVYAEYLDPKYKQAFADWRGAYRNPSKKHLSSKKTKNWDSAERLSDLKNDGVVGEIIFPNTVPPFYRKAFHISGPPRPEDYEHALAGIRTHNRWLADFCRESPKERAGIGLIHLNDIDDAIEDVKWIAENGLRGGVLLPLPSPAETWIKPLNHPDYDRLWAVIQDRDLVINQHSGQGSPPYPEAQGSTPLWAIEMTFFVQRGFTHLIMGGVFERFPKLRYILTESGASWAIPVMKQMDMMWQSWRRGNIGEIDASKDPALKEPPSFYAKRNCWYGASFPVAREIEGRHEVGLDRILWGNDYPHYEGSYPYSRENLRLAFADVDEPEVRMMLGENAAKLYGFDLEALRPAANEAGITPELVAQPLTEIPEDSQCLAFMRTRMERSMTRG
jgi:predicted TIM-barrel fold metal-dependent hydrolase